VILWFWKNSKKPTSGWDSLRTLKITT
jgi:hypothetical protein